MATGQHADRTGTETLPDVVGVRTRVVDRGRETVVVEFENGAELRYRAPAEDGAPVEEAWVAPGADPADPTVVNERGADAGEEALALRAVGEYLSFDDRRRAAFVWGERNLSALLGE
ncbi:hypothetical protein N0B31_19520 [Salinirubellus salinus]|jgi:hypothetical protein|uniref:Uncharacterized protein n=1 Tax=Salinirubellus salinus TaxID=1364945 RepID=A0A9E7R3V6_9EURY|nr:hypothetical protein [Salinirubellus salinus]UWM54293.1 hypothetical protein N0B31_19520 [Salinirubellus salinus]